MPPKSPIKLTQIYARLLDDALEDIDHVLAWVPAEEATPRCVLDDLEKVKARAKAKFERMDANYETQSVSDELTEDMKTACTKVYDEAKARYEAKLEAIEGSRPCKLEAKLEAVVNRGHRSN